MVKKLKQHRGRPRTKVRADGRKYRYKKKIDPQGKARFYRYVSKRKKDDPVKIIFYRKEPMSKDGYNNWARTLRPTLSKFVYRSHLRVDVDFHSLSTVDNIRALVLELIGHEGEFHMRSWGWAKTKTHVKFITLCKFTIFKVDDGLDAKVFDYGRISKYWYWAEN